MLMSSPVIQLWPAPCNRDPYLVVVGEYENHLRDYESGLGQWRDGHQYVVTFGGAA